MSRQEKSLFGKNVRETVGIAEIVIGVFENSGVGRKREIMEKGSDVKTTTHIGGESLFRKK